MKRKLLFVVNVDWFFVSHRLPIALKALKQDFEVHLACAVTDKKAYLEELGIIVHPLNLTRSGTNVLSEIRTFTQLYKLTRQLKPDLIHCVTIKAVLYGNITARLLKVPTRISSISGLGYTFIAVGFKAKLFRVILGFMYRVSLKGSKAVIFQNTADRDTLAQLNAIEPQQEIFIRGSGVDLRQYPVKPEPTGEPVVMFVARLLVDKGINEFVAAARLLEKSKPKIRMVLVGDIDLGNPKSVTNTQLDDWVEQGLVEHWGFSDDIASTMAKSNIIVLPSYREGLPKSLIEAAACGRAVITTDVPGCRDAIEPNKTGLLVSVKTVEPIADAIIKLIDNETQRHQFAINGRQLAEEAFDIQDVIKTHLAIYNHS